MTQGVNRNIMNILWNILVNYGFNVQDHWGSIDHSGIVPRPVGEKPRKEVCSTGKSFDSVHSRAR